MTETFRLTVPAAEPPRPTTLGGGPVTVTERWIAEDGVPRILVSGEIHFSRVPRAQWDDVLSAARAGGVTHVATYVLWNHHEPVRGEVSFDGDLDLRAFLELATAHGLGIVLRIGPYAHAETRHGGLPDWLVESGLPLRTDDPGYLAEAERWYRRIAAEVGGVEFFGIQVDNELYDRPEHLLTLRGIARDVGLDAPIWTATAWGAAQVPDELLGVYGGYPDSFWVEASDLRDLRSESNFVPSPVRDDDGIGADHRGDVASGGAIRDASAQPFVTCELGGGMISAYHRRPDVSARDVEALALAKLASGSVWQGYYMYADGRNPRRGLQESHALDEPNDFGELSYDFGAPLAVDARPRESWYRLRRQHLLLSTWGEQIAAAPAVFPEPGPVRWSVRSDGVSGFVCVVNHQPGLALPPQRDVVFALDLADGSAVEFPAVDVATGAAFVWPFGLRVGPATLRWATVQPVTEVVWRGMPLLVVAETTGVAPRFAWQDGVHAEPLEVDGPGAWLRVLDADEAVVAHVVVLDELDSLRVAVDEGRLVLAEGPVVDGEAVLWGGGDVRALDDVGWRTLTRAAVLTGPVRVDATRAAGEPPAWRTAPNGRASIPTDWSGAAEATVTIDDPEATVILAWEGDVARAWDGDRLVSDAIYVGREWRISDSELAGARRLRIEILPLADDAPVLVVAGRAASTRVVAARWERPRRVVLR